MKNKTEKALDISPINETKLSITLFSELDEQEFWTSASLKSINKVWDNSEDDVFEKLLKK
jgi:hypothetical protein